jgi:hypothetical protein
VDQSRREALIARYREGPAVVEAALEGVSEAELDHRSADGGWSAREVVHHLGDSEMTSGIRLRKLLAEDGPTIQGYDEAEYARRLHYASRPVGPSLAAMRAARQATAPILDLLGEEDWSRVGPTRRAARTRWRRGWRSTRRTPTTTRSRSGGPSRRPGPPGRAELLAFSLYFARTSVLGRM